MCYFYPSEISTVIIDFKHKNVLSTNDTTQKDVDEVYVKSFKNCDNQVERPKSMECT